MSKQKKSKSNKQKPLGHDHYHRHGTSDAEHDTLPSWMTVFMGSSLLKVIVLVVGVGLAVYALLGPLMNWPQTDESTYLLQAKYITEGKLIYEAFYDFVTPGSQYMMAGFAWCLQQLGVGFNITLLRLAVLAGWLVEITLLMRLAFYWPHPFKLSHPNWYRLSVWVLGIFLFLTDTRYVIYQHHFWSGLLGLVSVYSFLRYQQTHQQWRLIFSGVMGACTFWTTQTLGLAIIVGMLVYCGFCALGFSQQTDIKSNQSHWKDVFVWFGFGLLIHAGVFGWMHVTGIWQEFVRDSFQWLSHGHYADTTEFGYAVTLESELEQTLAPFRQTLPLEQLLLFLGRPFIALHMLLFVWLPVLAVLWGIVVTIQNRIRQNNQQLFLIIMAGGFLLATMSYSTTMHIVSHAGLGYLLSWLMVLSLASSLKMNVASAKILVVATFLFLGLVFVGALQGSWMFLNYAKTVTDLKGVSGSYIHAKPAAWLATVERIEDMVLLEELASPPSVFVVGQSPQFYLMAGFKNPTRFSLILPVYTSDEQQKEVVRDVELSKPQFMIYDGVLDTLKVDKRFEGIPEQVRAMPIILNIVSKNYILIAEYPPYKIYRRKP